MNTTDELLDVRQAARELGIEPRTLQRRIAAGTIKAQKFGSHPTAPYMISRAEVDRVKDEVPRCSECGRPLARSASAS